MAFHKKGESKYIPTSLETKPVVYRPKYKKSKRKKHSEHELPEICRFCINAHKLYDSDTMLCDRKGVVACEYSCKKFMYDPLKHIPAQSPVLKPESTEPLPSLDDFNEIDDPQDSESTQEKVSETAADDDNSINHMDDKEEKNTENADKKENSDVISVKKEISGDQQLLSQLAEIDKQYSILQNNLAEHAEPVTSDIQIHNMEAAVSNVFSSDNAAIMIEEPEDAESE